MNSAAVAELTAVGEGSTTDFMRSGHVGARGELCACANVTGETTLLGVTVDGEVVGMAETAERSRFG